MWGGSVMSVSFPIYSVNGMDRAFTEMTQDRREGIARVLLKYLRKSVHLINGPGRTHQAGCCAHWLSV